jgi:hypothetical protein
MGKLDWKSGRFNNDYETDQIFEALDGWQAVDGDWLSYYRFDEAHSEIDDVYDEPTGNGLIWLPYIKLQVLHNTHVEGGNEDSDKGFYFNDDLEIKVAFNKYIQAGMTRADIQTGNYLKDRCVYDRKVFRIKQISILGQMQTRDIIVAISATQLKPDELVMDTQFAAWAPGGAYTLQDGTQ